MVEERIQEHPAFVYNRIALRFGAAACGVSAATVLLFYPSPQNFQIGLYVAGLAVSFLVIGKFVFPRVKTALQLDLLVFVYLVPIFFAQWVSLVLMPEKEIPAGLACLNVLTSMLFTTNRAFLATCFFSSAMWLLVKYNVGSVTEVEMMQLLVMTPSVAAVARLAAGRTLKSLRESRQREEDTVIELRGTLRSLQTEQQLRRHSEEQLVRAQKTESLGVMAAGVAHDFNNTLFAINSLADIIEKTSSESSVRSHAVDISKAVQQASGICRQMLTYTGKDLPEKCRVDLVEITMALKPLLQASFRDRALLNVTTSVENAVIHGSPGQVQQMLMNLVTNSAESIQKNGVIEVRIDRVAIPVFATESQDRWPLEDSYQVVVADNGCGMPVEIVQQIFDPYFTTKGTGHGFGLSIVQGIARSHGADVSVQSQPGCGTTICVTFPAHSTPDQVNPSRMDTPNRIKRATISRAVLLIDDDALVRSSFASMLRLLGWDVVEADSGEAAVAIFDKRRDFFAIIVDYAMPSMNGRETLKALREKGCQARAILCSGFMAGEENPSAAAEFEAILQKPFRASELGVILARVAEESGSVTD